jgi:hypothetical protein
MRSLVAAAALASLACPLTASPASASGALVLTCTLAYNGGTGTGECTATGANNGAIVLGAVHMDFRPHAGCPGAGADGTMTGAVDASFVWTRVGAAGVITTAGDLNGAGPIAFSQPCQPIVGSETAVFTLGGA